MPAEASAPASSANLGPGYDALAIALELRCRVVAEAADEWSIEHREGQRPDRDSDDAVLAAARRAVGDDRPLHLVVHNDVPIGRGLGSSAAAIASGAAAAIGAHGSPVDPDDVFALTAELEGHPDNAAAAVYGGLVLVAADGHPHRLPLHPSIRPVVAVPREVFLTAEARQAVPDVMPTAAAVRTVARAAALVSGLLTADPILLRAARGDELHEAPRSARRPETADLVNLVLGAGALHAAWSGSGPSVIALVDGESRVAIVERLSDAGVTVLDVPVATTGLIVSA